ncbi:hypothetical protein OCK02_23120 [Rhizobium sp. TRM96647]|uniref:hypothetical protein n=1 Tax=unclassified Rhizobium TaxID=2613769 RepID=UPI0021E77849|nr:MULTISPECIES: hypothetical protein [unclassified Rhizobium]MCV3739070.1 hypothetical protein [Rhizobium sp. TRM96647]MCV3760787.1 hypothetical protein [Rhizobium sp. TRM96650]
MLMFLASVLDQTDLALEHIQNGSVHDARVGLAAGMSGFRNGPEIPERPGGRRKAFQRLMAGVPQLSGPKAEIIAARPSG